jgi:hypothetical protein
VLIIKDFVRTQNAVSATMSKFWLEKKQMMMLAFIMASTMVLQSLPSANGASDRVVDRDFTVMAAGRVENASRVMEVRSTMQCAAACHARGVANCSVFSITSSGAGLAKRRICRIPFQGNRSWVPDPSSKLYTRKCNISSCTLAILLLDCTLL